MNAQRARMKKQEHKREVDRLLEERRYIASNFLCNSLFVLNYWKNREMYERSRQAQLQEHQMDQQRENERRAIIEEERQRLLREHAVKLYGHLPKDIARFVAYHLFELYSN